MSLRCSLSKQELVAYVAKQIGTFFPDGLSQTDTENELFKVIDETLERLEVCIDSICLRGYHDNDGSPAFYHLHADQYATFLYFLSNTLWKNGGNKTICDKLLYLNRTLHSIFISYKCKLPPHFLLAHPVGTVLGNADYDDFLVISQGVTVNTDLNGGGSPHIGKGVFLSADCYIIGDSNLTIGNYVSVGVNCLVYQKSIPDNMVAKNINGSCVVEPRKRPECSAQRVFNIRF